MQGGSAAPALKARAGLSRAEPLRASRPFGLPSLAVVSQTSDNAVQANQPKISMERETIISEIQRTAADNGGIPLGRLKLESEAGIKEHHWKKYWPRFSDAVRAAGLEPNNKTTPLDRDVLIALLVDLARELGHFPTHAEIRVRSGRGSWPSHRVFDKRLGTKADMVKLIADYCSSRPELADVLAYCQAIPQPVRTPAPDQMSDGFVYLIRSGRYYKIGKTNSLGRREREVGLQLPERTQTVHSIKTDDPEGIEAYWHRRFASKRKNGEWFDLTSTDVAAFRRRKFM